MLGTPFRWGFLAHPNKRRKAARPSGDGCGGRGRSLRVEPLEDRRLLSGSPVYVEALSAGTVLSLLESRQLTRMLPTLPQTSIATAGDATELAQTLDAGDYYWADGRQVALYRRTDQILVGVHDGSSVGDLAGLKADRAVARNAVTFTTGVNLGAGLDATLAELGQLNTVQWASPVFVNSESGQLQWITDELVVALAPGADPTMFFSTDVYSAYRPLLGTPDQYIATVQAGGGTAVLALADALRSDPRVAWSAPNFYSEIATTAIANDTSFASQWHLDNTGQTGARSNADVNAPEAWNTTTGSSEVVIAVLDNGVQLNHPDLAANIFVNVDEIAGNGIDDDGNGWIDDVNGWDFCDGDNNPSPATAYDNHGTSVAGVAAAVGNNALGVSGAAMGVKILPLKIAKDADGSGGGFVSNATIAQAVYYAGGRTANGLGTWRGADVINDSWGGGSPDTTLTAAFSWATNSGRGGLGTPALNAAGNSASGYGQYSLTGVPAGSWIFEWRYEKDRSGSSGSDTVWLADVELPDGAAERFDATGLPSGWSSSTTSKWTVVDDPAHAYGTGRYVAKAGTIGNRQTTTLRSRTVAVTGTSSLTFAAWVSSASTDVLNLYASNNGGTNWSGPYFSSSGVPSVTSSVSYPASLSNSVPGMIAVGASTDWDYRSDYSQYGSGLDIVAPSSGGFAGITTTDRTGSDGYNTASGAAGDYTDAFGGTSSATPLAAGITALLLSRNPGLTAAQIRQTLRNTASKIGNVTYTSGFNSYYGYGRVDAAVALAAVTADGTGPSVLSAVLLDDTGASSTDRITKTAVQTITYTFNERTAWTGSGIAVKAPDGSTIVPLSYRGTGTKTLKLALPTLTQQGQYTVTLNAAGVKDQAGNSLSNGVNHVLQFTLDGVAPTADVVDVTPDPRTTAVDQIAIQFSEAVVGFDWTDLRLTRDGGANLLTSSQTLASSDGGRTWTLDTLAGLTASPGVYTLRVVAAGSGVSDAAGNPLMADAQDQWTIESYVAKPPTDILLTSASVPENQPAGTPIGSLSTVDLDLPNDSHTYALVAGSGGDDNASFTIEGNLLKAAASFDYETQPSCSIRIRSTDQTGLWTDRVFAIAVTNVNEAPTAVALSANTVAENQPAGTDVGTLSTTDPDLDGSYIYTLIGDNNDNASFTIEGNVLKTAASFDYETKAAYTVHVQSTDQGGLSTDQVFVIAVGDVNEAPTALTLSANTVAENQPAGAEVGTLSTVDPDFGETYSYSFAAGSDDDHASFAIEGNVLKTAAVFDYEMKAAYTIHVRSTDQYGVWTEQVFTIDITDVNEAPTAAALSEASVEENQPAGTVVGTLSTTDPDTGNSHTYTLAADPGGNDNAWFTLDGDVLKTAAPFDYESKSSYTVRIRSTDQDGLWIEQDILIAVTDVNEAPTAVMLSAATVAENLPAGTVVGTLSTADPDVGSSHTYTLAADLGGNDNTWFTIEGDVLKTTASFDYESKSSYTVRVRSIDQEGLWTEQTLVIDVTNVNEPPVPRVGGPYEMGLGTEVTLDASGSTDPDQGDSLEYAWDLDNDGDYADASGAAPVVAYARLLELGIDPAGRSIPVGLLVTDSLGLTATVATTIEIRDGNIAGTAAADWIRIARDPDQTDRAQVFLGPSTAVPNYSIVLSMIDQWIVAGGDGDDRLTVDFSHGDPLPGGGLHYDGGTAATGDTLVARGTDNTDRVTLESGTLTYEGPMAARTMGYSGVEFFAVELGAGPDQLTIHNATMTLGSPDAISDATSVIVDGGTLDLAGQTETIASLIVTSGTVSGGQLIGGAFEIQGGTVTAGLSGPGGLKVTAADSVTLTAANSYTGGTTVVSGTLMVGSSGALPVGRSLTIGAGGTLVLSSSLSLSPLKPTEVAVNRYAAVDAVLARFGQ